ncbi:hypothetical protein ALI144C_25085 [Actinosynnema sp. ALI-1.44]|uniref:DUF6480 family protein n=1 Tax=Actinosynnema sp. ALI-1.44 TaxID=1933779 RepID=UPI00097C0C4C|nr:DUF6480 family protein [Actinosynnema sp. ALI-1.44]ONI79989.1 hypothetical protein ALI144C_25085 [Actinosynnema sp. ALI-1.44]
MTALPPDPDPNRTPGLEPGGGVRPGDTPPDSGSVSGLSHPQPMPGRTGPILTYIIVGLIAVCAVGLVIAQLVGLIDVLW